MSSWVKKYQQCFHVRGQGDTAGATAIQARLREHGSCSYFCWDPRPPRWRFFYETNLCYAELERLLAGLADRFKVVIED